LGKGGAKNAAVLAAQILALKRPAIAERLLAYREDMRRAILESDRK
jgi:5-(carboxyamino)imidazole ribonucleotide mutase